MTKALTTAALFSVSLAMRGFAAPLVPPLAPTMPPQETLTRLGINPTALAGLLKRGAGSHSDAIVIIKDDQVVGQWYFGKPQVPIEAMSATKSIASLAIGCLRTRSAEGSLDTIKWPCRKTFSCLFPFQPPCGTPPPHIPFR